RGVPREPRTWYAGTATSAGAADPAPAAPGPGGVETLAWSDGAGPVARTSGGRTVTAMMTRYPCPRMVAITAWDLPASPTAWRIFIRQLRRAYSCESASDNGPGQHARTRSCLATARSAYRRR